MNTTIIIMAAVLVIIVAIMGLFLRWVWVMNVDLASTRRQHSALIVEYNELKGLYNKLNADPSKPKMEPEVEATLNAIADLFNTVGLSRFDIKFNGFSVDVESNIADFELSIGESNITIKEHKHESGSDHTA